jgi:hypothetical protein
MHPALPFLAVAAIGLSTPALAAGDAVVRGLAQAVDIDRDARLTPGEMRAANRLVFRDIDRDGSGAMTLDEMMGWDYGLAAIAERAGRMQAFAAVMRLMHAIMDADGSGAVDEAEHDAAVSYAWTRADRDRDGVLSRDEFEDVFVLAVALRAALSDWPEASSER